MVEMAVRCDQFPSSVEMVSVAVNKPTEGFLIVSTGTPRSLASLSSMLVVSAGVSAKKLL